jgi:hypothetical protein
MKRIAVLLSAFAAVILLSVPASAAPAAIRIGSCRAHGQFATCVASGNANHHPVTIVLHVRATPTQAISGSWSMTCAKGFGAGGSSGNVKSGTPVNRALRKPYRRPDNCSVAADAQLNRGGSLRVWLTYTS